jgi:hypothetical protein
VRAIATPASNTPLSAAGRALRMLLAVVVEVVVRIPARSLTGPLAPRALILFANRHNPEHFAR